MTKSFAGPWLTYPRYLLSTVVKATVLLDDINNFGAVNEVYAKCK